MECLGEVRCEIGSQAESFKRANMYLEPPKYLRKWDMAPHKNKGTCTNFPSRGTLRLQVYQIRLLLDPKVL